MLKKMSDINIPSQISDKNNQPPFVLYEKRQEQSHSKVLQKWAKTEKRGNQHKNGEKKSPKRNKKQNK